jgi:CheY-like chemotaxis protein
MLLPQMTGPDVLQPSKKDPATAGIAVVAFTGLSQTMRHASNRMALALLEKSQLGLDKGCETWLAGIVRNLHRDGPPAVLTAN